MAARPDDADDPVEEPDVGAPADPAPAPGQEPGQGPDQQPGPDEAGTTGPARAGVPQAGVPQDATEQSADQDDVESQWADIVARLGDVDVSADSGARPGASPGGPDLPERRRRTDEAADPLPGRTIRPARSADDPRSWLPDPVLEEAENHFEPPDPGPVLGGDPLLTMAWVVVVGVPVLLIVVVVLGRDVPGVLLAAAGALLAAAVGLLLWRMPHGDDDDRTGPGAVV
jgi:hypothetical protein